MPRPRPHTPAPRPGPSRRTVLRAGAAALAGGTAYAAAGPSHAAPASRTAAPVFDLETAAEPLFTHARLHHDRTILQSFAFDGADQHCYTVQIVQGGTDLPGDAPGDSEYAERNRRGDLTLTRLDADGTRTGHMYLKGFGHGVSIGFEPGGHLWSEVDAVTEGASGWGTRLLRFPFDDGAVIDAAETPGLDRRVLVDGADRTTANVDPAHERLVMRYRVDGGFRFAVYDVADATGPDAEPLFDVAQPAELTGTTFQGYTVFGDHLYLLDGEIYGDGNPPGSGGNTHLTRVDLRDGTTTQRVRTLAGEDLHRREPEGMGIHLTDPADPSSAGLCFGFGTSTTPDPDASRLATIYRIPLP
ncbi:hypothetical protein CLV63_10330 [Murinocardiopsis flavida]|uniref:P68 RBP/TagC-like beta-propeller domain-containing protein n=1 Tax=Murinocardiopsis flavida TaxID=645275 RepID=A0A2P8DQ00_9ACTN|nr:hypothetical protein [Murinocardiopsis flavida]PSK99309.1 hypothetical protein CLV63_10330 [Murinocardiopsis flavida]